MAWRWRGITLFLVQLRVEVKNIHARGRLRAVLHCSPSYIRLPPEGEEAPRPRPRPPPRVWEASKPLLPTLAVPLPRAHPTSTRSREFGLLRVRDGEQRLVAVAPGRRGGAPHAALAEEARLLHRRVRPSASSPLCIPPFFRLLLFPSPLLVD